MCIVLNSYPYPLTLYDTGLLTLTVTYGPFSWFVSGLPAMGNYVENFITISASHIRGDKYC